MPSEEDKNPPRRPAPARAVKTTVPMPCKKFPIVAIGASAGGLEALAQFLGHVPVGCGMAFVIIQHLDPDHKGMMPELLQRTTLMPVMQAKNRIKVRPDCVYFASTSTGLGSPRRSCRSSRKTRSVSASA